MSRVAESPMHAFATLLQLPAYSTPAVPALLRLRVVLKTERRSDELGGMV